MSRRPAFTLLELLLAVVVLASVSVLGVRAYLANVELGREQSTLSGVSLLIGTARGVAIRLPDVVTTVRISGSGGRVDTAGVAVASLPGFVLPEGWTVSQPATIGILADGSLTGDTLVAFTTPTTTRSAVILPTGTLRSIGP